MNDIKKLTKAILKFRDARDWKQFHNPKDSAIALASEALEVLDELKFKDKPQIKEYFKKNKQDFADELSDVLFWILLLAYDQKIDLLKAFERKMKQNEKKYPVSKARGNNTKYTKL